MARAKKETPVAENTEAVETPETGEDKPKRTRTPNPYTRLRKAKAELERLDKMIAKLEAKVAERAAAEQEFNDAKAAVQAAMEAEGL